MKNLNEQFEDLEYSRLLVLKEKARKKLKLKLLSWRVFIMRACERGL